MAQWVENAAEEQQQGGFGGAAGSIAQSWLTFDYSFATLNMIQNGAKAGYYVPWTRIVDGKKNIIAGIGNKFGIWGPGGWGSKIGAANASHYNIFNKAGLRGFSRASEQVASKVARRSVLKAGRGLYGTALSMGSTEAAAARFATKFAVKQAGVIGARASTVSGAKFLAGRLAGIANPLLTAAIIGEQVVGGIYGGYQFLADKFGRSNTLELGGNFSDSQGAVTSRQRALQAITSSQLQARSAIGNEAMLFHRG